MILAHLIIGMLTGMIAAAVLWQLDYPLWLMLLSYSLVGGFGLLTSALVGLAVSWLADSGPKTEYGPSSGELTPDGP